MNRLPYLLLICASICAAQSPVCAPIVQGDSIPYAQGQFLDSFVPASSEPVTPVVVIHGRSGNRRTHINQVLQAIEKSGQAWFSIDARDEAGVRSALAFIECPGRFNIRGKPILVGEDIGAGLALTSASTGVASSVVTFGASITVSLQEPPVPVLMFHGDGDEDSPFSKAQALCHSWSNCTFVPIPNGIHNVENWHPDQWFWKEDFIAWLRADQRGLWKDIAYSLPEGRPLLMDAFLPQGVGPFPAVIVVHGGGWEAGDKQTYVSPILDVLARSGFVYFSIDYRLTPYVRNETQVEDVRQAIRYIRAHAERFHILPNSVSLLGESAGGQIVTQLASLPCQGCAPNAVVSFYGVYDFAQFAKDAEGRQMLARIFGKWTPSTLRSASPLNHIGKNLPPLLLLQGTKDELYPGSLAYSAALNANGIPHKLVILDGAPHGMENWVNRPDWLTTLDDVAQWLHQQQH